MNFLIDLIVIVLIALITFIGYKRGLIKVLFGLFCFSNLNISCSL